MRFVFLLIALLSISFAIAQEKPSYISFKQNNGKTEVLVHNKLGCPTHLKILNTTTKEVYTSDIKAYEKKPVLTLSEKDTLSILKNYKFSIKYGTSYFIKKYDTLYNYALPFLKGKRYKIIQGNNTNFTHKGLSRYAIDFRMNVGQTICAMRDGVVVGLKKDSNKGGRSKKFKNDGNYILLYHEDGLYTQYVHLKKDGVLVKKGDSVKKNQPIGYSGNTGYSTEPHLHFGVYKITKKGFASIPYILDSIPSRKYVKGKYAFNN
ncbi:Peptidase_M23 domain-containing protein [Tenacibaculum sp. 190524A05c]|uniref:M23 family metallopeptidase n=1 Tax=Tenacibaculum platacis TaxID=3137852 RepID=UPI0031FA81C9